MQFRQGSPKETFFVEPFPDSAKSPPEEKKKHVVSGLLLLSPDFIVPSTNQENGRAFLRLNDSRLNYIVYSGPREVMSY